MSAQSEIDSLRFAQTAGHLSGESPVAALTRLHDVLSNLDGVLHWQLDGDTTAGRPVLRLRVSGQLSMVCQRCLGPYVHALQIESVLPIARDEEELARWESEDPLLDGLVADVHLNVQDLLEDEILLSLPMVPRHADGTCRPADYLKSCH